MIQKYCSLFQSLQQLTLKDLLENKLTLISEDRFNNMIEYFEYKKGINKKLSVVKNYSKYSDLRKKLKKDCTYLSLYNLTTKLIEFERKYRFSKGIYQLMMRDKKQITLKQFEIFKLTFPCMISSVRDYSKYIPHLREIYLMLLL